MKMQSYERDESPNLPLHCVICGQLVVGEIGDAAPELKPCDHTLFIAFSEGFEFLSERAIRQLRQKGFKVTENPLEVTPPDEHCEDSMEDITDQLEFPDALKITSYDPGPFGVGLYVGFAPLGKEGAAEPPNPSQKL